MPTGLNNLHHANLLIGNREDAEIYLADLTKKLEFKIANNPDFFAFRVETFGIDEARQLKLLSVRKAINEIKIFFISPAQITIEAQNALLKTFEDPYPQTHFFLVVGEESAITKTLLSRMQSQRLPKVAMSGEEGAKSFLALSIKDRLLFVKKFVDNESNLKTFLDALLSVLKESGQKDSVANVFRIRKQLGDTSLLPRLALEHLSLVL